MKFLVAPDSFKGTMSAGEVCDAIGAGLVEAGAEVDLCPVADGGEGTAEIVRLARSGERVEAAATDPFGRPLDRAGFTMCGQEAFIDLAEASGLALLDPAELDPEHATTRGTGELMLAAAGSGASSIYVASGGSATVDGGRGAIEKIAEAGGLGDTPVTVLCDVDTPFEEAAEVFGPQKGADEAMVRKLTARLQLRAAGFPRDPRGRPMTGSAGGFAGGAWAVLGAELVPGAAFVLDLLDFDRRLTDADAVIVGEGRIDGQSFVGKIIGEIVSRARNADVAVHAVVGSSGLGDQDPSKFGLSSLRVAGDPDALERAGATLGQLSP